MLLAAFRSEAAPDRKNWVFAQLAESPRPTVHAAGRHQAGVSVANYADDLSLAVSGVVDLKLLELRPLVSRRVLPDLTARGSAVGPSLEAGATTLAVEAARYYATIDGDYGRLGLGVVYFTPSRLTFLKIAATAGVLSTPVLPWTFRLDAVMFIPIGGGPAIDRSIALALRGEVLADRVRVGSGATLRLGGYLSWVNRMTDLTPLAPGVYESMRFSAGPQAELELGSSSVRLSVGVDVYVDKQLTTPANLSPSDWSVPSVSLSWGQQL